MNWLESLFYGLISGICEYLPISSFAHQQILLHLFGVEARDPVRELFIHIGMLIAVTTCCKSFLDIIKRERATVYRKQHSIQKKPRLLRDWQLITTAVFPMIFIMILVRYIIKPSDNLMLIALFLVINGIIIFLPERMVRSNKEAGSMSDLDGFLIGSFGALSAFSGISRIGCTYSLAVIRGAAQKHALTWSLILSIYALVCLCIMDIIAVFSIGIHGFWSNFFSYIISGITALGGSVGSIKIMRHWAARPGNSGFSYYCWGVALISCFLFFAVG